MTRATRRRAAGIAMLAVAMTFAASGCSSRAPMRRSTRTPSHPVVARGGAIERGAVAYAVYCEGCHGARRDGLGKLSAMLNLHPADLRVAALWRTADDALVARLVGGTPLEVPAGTGAPPEREIAADAVGAYVAMLGQADWDLLRAGRVVYDESCAACHGPYGRADGAVGRWLGAPDLLTARERVSDATLARITNLGTGAMPPLQARFDAVELRALVAWVRHLSDGFRVYDTYCADCHGDDGAGLYSDELVPPAGAAPPIAGTYPRAQLLHMLDHEHGFMPHFRDVLDEARLRDVLAYLRAAAAVYPR